jgi:hypothetical protein
MNMRSLGKTKSKADLLGEFRSRMMERGETMQEVLSKCRVEEVIQESAIEGTMKSIVIIEEASKSMSLDLE